MTVMIFKKKQTLSDKICEPKGYCNWKVIDAAFVKQAIKDLKASIRCQRFRYPAKVKLNDKIDKIFGPKLT